MRLDALIPFETLTRALESVYDLAARSGAPADAPIRYVVRFGGLTVLLSSPAIGRFPLSWRSLNGVSVVPLLVEAPRGGGEQSAA